MELICIEHQTTDPDITLLEVYAKDGLTKVLMEEYRYTEPQLIAARNNIDDFNERQWKYPEALKAVQQAIYKKRHDNRMEERSFALKNYHLIQNQATIQHRLDRIDRYQSQRSPLDPEEARRREAKRKATILSNKHEQERIHAFIASQPKERFAGVDNNSYFSSGLNGCYTFYIYVDESMSDDVYGFGDIKVQQTLDDDVESLYAYYEDYIF